MTKLELGVFISARSVTVRAWDDREVCRGHEGANAPQKAALAVEAIASDVRVGVRVSTLRSNGSFASLPVGSWVSEAYTAVKSARGWNVLDENVNIDLVDPPVWFQKARLQGVRADSDGSGSEDRSVLPGTRKVTTATAKVVR